MKISARILAASVISIIGLTVAGCGESSAGADSVAGPEPTDASAATFQAVDTVEDEPSASPSPSPSEAEYAPAISPDLEIIEIEGFGWAEAMEANLSDEEIQARETIYEVIPVLANKASARYDDGYGARNELLERELITQRMADEWFMPEFTAFEEDLNSTEFSVQTTGIRCFMRGQTPMTAIEMGQVTCYYERRYVDSDGATVSNYEFVNSPTGGAGSIDPDQTARVLVYVSEEGGIWKVDDVQFNAR